MPDDPTTPGWRPEYTGDTSLGDVGSGTRLGAHCYYLYRAGRNELPGVARTYSGLTSKVHRTTASMRALFDVPGRGMEVAHLRLLDLRDELHNVLRMTCLRMREVGEVLATTAAAYAATDAAAVDELTRLLEEAEDVNSDTPEARNWETQPPIVPELPAVDAPPPPPLHDDTGLVPPNAPAVPR